MFLDTSLVGGVATALVRAWRRGGRKSRIAIGAAFAALVVGILIAIASDSYLIEPNIGRFLAYVFIIPAASVVVISAFFESGRQQSEAQEEIKQAEARFRASPDRPTAAWELASLKLESYIDRNLSQVRWIFILVLLIMAGGFGIIGTGVWKVYENPANLGPSIVAAASGIIVQFIGATFLVVYRSTVEQARDYVSILERINAVGMSVQILENIEEAQKELRDKARIDIAKGLLFIYEEARHRPQARRTSRASETKVSEQSD